jgi:Tfp pilus assembly protein PilX
MNIIPTLKSNKGYTLLFAVIVSVLVLSISTFILSVSRKQLILSSSARDSVYAFYAADSGLECALLNLTKLASSTPVSSIPCDGVSQTVVQLPSSDDVYGMTTFHMYTGNYSGAQQVISGATSCAIVQTTYTKTGVMKTTTVVVESRGYNIGWNGTDCSATGPRKVERALKYTTID